ncbi:MAG: ABC transporter substrate-binding protein [Spirochaetaceae bacterium]|jgi:peptide/nickel transport system substrate-binding protein|nr:ABC transporter substrate-binding protein [Spirochaetaceae bacterium]
MRKFFVRGGVFLSTLLLVEALVACSSRKAEDQTLMAASTEVPATLDPTGFLDSSFLVRIGIGEMLFWVSPEGTVEPSLAESITEIDANTWEIKIRPDAYFWSGAEVNADRVIASLERSRALNIRAAPSIEGMSFTKIDDKTIRVKTEKEYMQVPLNLAYYQFIIHNVDPPYTYKDVSTVDFTGLYKIVEHYPNQKLVLTANDKHWGQNAIIKNVIQEEIPDENARVLAALSGRYHIVSNIPFASVDQFNNSSTAKIVAVNPANTETVYLNLRKPLFQDLRVRQALSWGLDRAELVLLGAEGQSTPVTTWLGSNPLFPEAKTAVYGYDFQKASALLDGAGWTLGADGFRYNGNTRLAFRLLTWGVDKALGEAVQGQLARLGVNVDVRFGDYELLVEARKTGDWDAFIEAWTTFGNTGALLRGQYAPEGGANYGGFNDSAVNDLLAKLDAPTEEERNAIASQVNLRAAEMAPALYMSVRPEVVAVSKKLNGFIPHFRQYENLTNNPDLSFADAK